MRLFLNTIIRAFLKTWFCDFAWIIWNLAKMSKCICIINRPLYMYNLVHMIIKTINIMTVYRTKMQYPNRNWRLINLLISLLHVFVYRLLIIYILLALKKTICLFRNFFTFLSHLSYDEFDRDVFVFNL